MWSIHRPNTMWSTEYRYSHNQQKYIASYPTQAASIHIVSHWNEAFGSQQLHKSWVEKNTFTSIASCLKGWAPTCTRLPRGRWTGSVLSQTPAASRSKENDSGEKLPHGQVKLMSSNQTTIIGFSLLMTHKCRWELSTEGETAFLRDLEGNFSVRITLIK